MKKNTIMKGQNRCALPVRPGRRTYCADEIHLKIKKDRNKLRIVLMKAIIFSLEKSEKIPIR
jgi:hypothetical protein